MARKLRKNDRAFSLAVTLIILLVVAVGGISLMTLSATLTSIARDGFQKTEATELGEAGLNILYNNIEASMASNGSYATSLASTPATSTFGGVATADGSYSGTVVSASSQTTPITNGVQTTYTFVLSGSGTAASGTASTVHGTLTCTQIQTYSSGSGSGSSGFGNAALTSNGNVQMGNYFRTQDDSGTSSAAILANGVTSMDSTRAMIQGTISVAPNSYAASVTAMGTAVNNYQCSPTNAITKLAASVGYPTASLINSWQSTWLSDAQSGTTVAGGYSTVGSTPTTLTSPMYINGNFNINNGANLTLAAASSSSKPSVIYVNGNINFTSASSTLLYNSGVVLVCTGTITTASGSSDQYSVTNGTNGKPQYTASALISLASSSNAITLGSNTSDNVGLIYAVNGGINISGNGTLYGGVIAGGSGSTGGVVANANMCIDYPQNLITNFTGFPANSVLTVTQPYAASQMGSWVQVL